MTMKCLASRQESDSDNPEALLFDGHVRSALPFGYCILGLALLIGSRYPSLDAHYRYANLFYFLLLSTSAQFVGSHRSLLLSEKDIENYTIRFNQSLFAPLSASLALFSLYLQMKYFPFLIDNISTFFRVYFFFVGIGAIYLLFGSMTDR